MLAANVDIVLVATSLNRDLNARRVERFLTVAWESGARPVVVLTKVDLARDPVEVAIAEAQLEEVAAGVPVVAYRVDGAPEAVTVHSEETLAQAFDTAWQSKRPRQPGATPVPVPKALGFCADPAVTLNATLVSGTSPADVATIRSPVPTLLTVSPEKVASFRVIK